MKRLHVFLLFSLSIIYSTQANTASFVDNVPETTYMKKVFSSATLRKQFSYFLTDILKMVPVDKLYLTTEAIRNQFYRLNDTLFYAKLLDYAQDIQYWPSIVYKKIALEQQKAVLSQFALELLGQTDELHNCVEIDSPATYLSRLQHDIPINGTIYAVGQKEQLGDYFMASRFDLAKQFKAYDIFVSHNNYEPIDERQIPTSSVNVIMCTAGLHHVPQEKLDGFIASLVRILKPGGTFLLREHDCDDSDTYALTHCAHSIFNIFVANASVEQECNEYRNFQPLAYWLNLLEKHGFSIDDKRCMIPHDPTKNTMLKCIKTTSTAADEIRTFADKMKEDESYTRDITQTFLTGPEWVNVDLSQEYGSFINHTPFYKYPYMESIKSYWKVFGDSFNAARKKSNFAATLTSPYTLMNLFVGTAMTLEYCAKSLISAPIRLAYQDEPEADHIKAIVVDPKNEIQIIPGVTVHATMENQAVKCVAFPRYKQFLECVKIMSSTAMQFEEIAGQRTIQCKVRYKKDMAEMVQTQWPEKYTWSLPTQPDYEYAAICIDVKQLMATLRTFAISGIEILYVHDF